MGVSGTAAGATISSNGGGATISSNGGGATISSNGVGATISIDELLEWVVSRQYLKEPANPLVSDVRRPRACACVCLRVHGRREGGRQTEARNIPAEGFQRCAGGLCPLVR